MRRRRPEGGLQEVCKSLTSLTAICVALTRMIL